MLASFLLFVLMAVAMGSPVPSIIWRPHRSNANFFTALTGTCSMNMTNIPTAVSDFTLPSPTGQRLQYVAVGRGIQNYTCDGKDPTATPAPIGAIAALYNANCIVQNYPYMIDKIPDILLQFSVNSTKDEILASDSPNLLGHHRFGNSTTAVFDLNTASHRYGQVIAYKADSMKAPNTSPVGQPPILNGAVAWLYLLPSPDSKANVTSIYRTNTAGGSPPVTCEGQKEGTLSVEYSALYWFFTK